MTSENTKNSFFSAFDAFIGKLTTGINVVLAVLLLGMGVILGANIALRFLFEYPISWSNVITRYAYIYIVLLGTAVSYIEGGHAQIDFVYNLTFKRGRIFFDLLHYLCMLFLCVFLIVFGVKHVITMWPVHSPVLKFLSIGVVYLSVPISAAVMMIYLLKKVIELFSGRGAS
jgi:TRAP-type C4-dicarboxylate transport system permease small subunit